VTSHERRKRIGVIGAGVIGRARLAIWPRLGVDVSGVCARHFEHAVTAARIGGCRPFDSVDALLARSDVADICLPTDLHYRAVEQAARAHCDIICEKPLAIDEADVEAMFDLCEAAEVRLFVAMVVRFFPQYRAALQQVQSGQFGAVREIVLTRVGSPPPPMDSWFHDDRRSGGMLTDLLIHDVDYAMWVAGKVDSVTANVERAGARQYARMVLTHVNGVVTCIEGGWLESGPPLDAHGSIRCERGVVEIAPGNAAVPASDPYEEQLRHFLHSLGSGTAFLVGRDEVVHETRVLAAARQSAATGRAVSI